MAADLLSLTEGGEIDGCPISSSYLSNRACQLGLFDKHFVVLDRRLACALLGVALWDRKFGKHHSHVRHRDH